MLTIQATDLTPQKCEILFPLSVSEVSLFEKDDVAAGKIATYIDSTLSLRNKEQDLTDTYIQTHREIANKQYIEKSTFIQNELDLSDDRIKFSSEFAPMIIAELTGNEIIELASNSDIEDINLYNEPEYAEISIVSDSAQASGDEATDLAHESMGLNQVYNKFGLDGSGVKIGLVEGDVPGIIIDNDYTYSRYGFTSDNLLKVTYDQNDGLAYIQDTVNEAISNFGEDNPLKIISIAENENYEYLESDPHTNWDGQGNSYNLHSHANNTVRVMIGDDIGIAKGSQVYATLQGRGKVNPSEYIVYSNTEALVKCGINILEVNYAIITDSILDNSYISNTIKYYDHLVSHHNVTVVVAGGNRYSDSEFGQWINPVGLAYNVITVGGYNVTRDDESGKLIYTRKPYKWQNSNDEYGVYACEKPDVLCPACYSGGGTSVASPSMAATIALMMQLKPSLKLQPQAIKAIILASCHKKAEPYGDEEHEYINNGITNKQGAGIPDAWIMTRIICQGTYGIGTLSSSQYINMVEQPPYEATNINVSATWLNENIGINEHTNISDIIAGVDSYLALSVYQNNMAMHYSNVLHSSTEMCYFPLSANNFRYGIELYNFSPHYVRYGYAWSTDNMDGLPAFETSSNYDGIYFIRNLANQKYITNDVSATNSYQQFKLRTVTNQNSFADIHKWILQSSNSGYTLCTGYGSTKSFLGVSNITNGTDWYADMTNTTYELNILLNDDGTYSFLNSDCTKILAYKASYLVWSNYDSSESISDSAKWYFNKVNYYLGDANTDGYIDVVDIAFIQRVMTGLSSNNNIQAFLGDVNRDGYCNQLDINYLTSYILHMI